MRPTCTQTETKHEETVPDSSARAVCLVDDDASVRRSVTRLIESAGFKVLAFSEPKRFLQHLATNAVPVAVLDIWMEKMNGMELLAYLCARSPETRVIFITAYDDPAARATVMQIGAFAFFMKPLDDEPFLQALQAAFDSYVPQRDKLRPKTPGSVDVTF
jgi:FixJ family two-component response regulator